MTFWTSSFVDQVRYTKMEGVLQSLSDWDDGKGAKIKTPIKSLGCLANIFSAIFPLEITHYLPQKATMVALLEGVGHAMPSGWSIQNFVVFRRKKLPLSLGRATGIPPLPPPKKKTI